MSEKFRDSARPRAAAARALAALCLAALLAAGGCAMPVFKAGKPPPVDRLAQLKVAVSTTEEVRAALGEPQGRGAVRLPQTGLQDIWLYEYDVVNGFTAHLRILMVFVDKEEGRYGGYMWFSSGQLLGMTR
jgi:hypothetical protein